MKRMQMKIILVFLLNTVLVVNSQTLDSSLCPMGAILTTDQHWTSIPLLFQIHGELVSSTDLIEITQTFSTTKDSYQMIHPVLGDVSFYWNYETNEVFDIYHIVLDSQVKSVCVRQVITSNSQTSNIQPDTLLMKPSVLLGYDHRNQPNPNWGVVYNGTTYIREMPAHIFRSCFYLSDIHATISATYYISDSNQFESYLPKKANMILQIDVSAISDELPQQNYVYNIFDYVSDLSEDEAEEQLDTGEHIFCPKRINSLSLPNDLPTQFSFNQERFQTTQNFTLKSELNIFDRIVGFVQMDSWIPMVNSSKLSRLIELDDFATGLHYQYDQEKKSCSISPMTEGVYAVPIDPQSNFLGMVDTLEYFFRVNITYQYIGKKTCFDQVRCHVWIGETSAGNDGNRLRREWYWAFEMNGKPLVQWIPTRMISTQLNQFDEVLSAFTTNLFNFLTHPSSLDGVDQLLIDCYRSIGPTNNFTYALIGFIVINDRDYSVQNTIHSLQNSIREALSFLTEIRPIRISNIIINRDVKSFSVQLTLLDAVPYLGPVESLLTELPLTDVIDHLRREIDTNNVIIRAKEDNREVSLPIQINSLYVIYNGFVPEVNSCINETTARNLQVDECPNVTTTYETVESISETDFKSTGPMITGIWIGFGILGIFIGMIGGTFVLTKISK